MNTGAAQLLTDLDAQPWPDRERIDMQRYLDAWREHHGAGSISVITARGCPYHCRWCSHSTFGKTHRRRSPAAVVDEVEWILHRYQPEQLWIADDVFTIHHGWLDQYAAEMRRRGLRIPFECITRADRMTPRVAAQLAELGLFARMDRFGKRLAAHARCHGARRECAASARCRSPTQRQRN